MKRLLFLLFLCGSIITVYSNPLTPKKELSVKQTNCTDILNVSANTIYPVKVSFNTLGWGADDIELAVIDDTITNHQVSHFTKHVSTQTDTLIYLPAGKYYLAWLNGGASLQEPKLSGASLSTSHGGWTSINNYVELPFKVIDQNVVYNDQISLNAATSYSGSGKLRYKWSPSTGLDNDTIVTPTATITSGITYTVIITSPSGCTASSDIKVEIMPLTANAGADITVVCGNSALLNYITTNYNKNGTLKYKWTPSIGLSNDTIEQPTVTAASDMTYTVTVTFPNGITATDNINVLVTPLTANAGAEKTTVCGGSVQLNNITTNFTGTGKLKYKWTPSTGLNNDTIANPTATVLKDITYTVTVSTPNGCSATDQVTISIIPMAKPEIGIVSVSSSNKNRVVWNKPVSTGIASYNIYRETNVSDVYEKIGNVPYDSLSVFVDNLSAPDVKSTKYKLSILDQSGLESPLSSSHKTMHLTINKGQNGTWNLIWEPYEGFAASTYNIYRGTNATNLNFIDATSGSSTQYSDISSPGSDVYYQLEVICPTLINPTKTSASIQKSKDREKVMASSLVSYSSSRSNIATNAINGINELDGENDKINIYPNPVKNEFRIAFEGGSTFDIQNLMGQVVYSGNLNNSTTVQTSAFSSGVYLIRFKTGNTYEYKKIIKE